MEVIYYTCLSYRERVEALGATSLGLGCDLVRPRVKPLVEVIYYTCLSYRERVEALGATSLGLG
ncbi:MAG: hypothetical protein CMJ59_23195, partial [Planctomycetaceae bacterium]|nr:hypothetical protein [Planctomycetaceae bacterium]